MVKQGHIRRKPNDMKKLNWRVILSATIITALAIASWIYIGEHNNEARLKEKLQKQESELQTKIDELNKTHSNVEELQKQKKDLEQKLQAKSMKKVYAATLPVKPVRTAVNSSCGDNQYARYIYQHESGCRTTARNSIGCYGIGQSCPASKIAHCGSDYACQNRWFSNYATQRYGSWYKAYIFWLGHRYW